MEELETSSLATQHSLLLVRMRISGEGLNTRPRCRFPAICAATPCLPRQLLPRPRSRFAAHAALCSLLSPGHDAGGAPARCSAR